jgi:hypothetical protein
MLPDEQGEASRFGRKGLPWSGCHSEYLHRELESEGDRRAACDQPRHFPKANFFRFGSAGAIRRYRRLWR